MNLRLRDLFRFLHMHNGPVLFHDGRGLAYAGVVAALVYMVAQATSAGTAVSWLQLFSKWWTNSMPQTPQFHIFECASASFQGFKDRERAEQRPREELRPHRLAIFLWAFWLESKMVWLSCHSWQVRGRRTNIKYPRLLHYHCHYL